MDYVDNVNDNNNNCKRLHFPAHGELGMYRASLASPEQGWCAKCLLPFRQQATEPMQGHQCPRCLSTRTVVLISEVVSELMMACFDIICKAMTLQPCSWTCKRRKSFVYVFSDSRHTVMTWQNICLKFIFTFTLIFKSTFDIILTVTFLGLTCRVWERLPQTHLQRQQPQYH